MSEEDEYYNAGEYTSDEYTSDDIVGADLINMDYDDAYNRITCFKRDDMVIASGETKTISTKYIRNETTIWDTKELGYNSDSELLYVKRMGVESTKPIWVPDDIIED